MTLKTLLNARKKAGAESKLRNITLVLIAMIIIASFSSPNFLDRFNLQSVVRDLAFVSTIAIGQSCLLLLGELDLSVGKIASLCGVLAGMLMVNFKFPVVIVPFICILAGMLFGVLNGTIITRLKLNAMVVTIGMQGLYGGVNLVLTKGKAIIGIPASFTYLGKGTFLGIPMPFVFTLIVLIIVLFLTQKTRYGRYLYAIGNNREAAEIMGINVTFIRTMTYALVGALAALSGVLMVARLGASQPSIGDSWVMNSIAASVIGGVALTGGIGSPAGALLGACIISIIQNMIVLLGVNIYWQTAVSGVVVVIAISLDSIGTLVSLNSAKRRAIANSEKEKDKENKQEA
ncbi:MAG: ABC transporter permease [Fusobacteriaceae bacterium]|jgi:ribose transport system permease protein|nr:ABC transporter permease [Fusobacteriaceae bacterium]